MNKDQMKNNVGKRMLLQPPAQRLRSDGSVDAPPSDDWWLIEDVTPTGVKISDSGAGVSRVLGYDHIQKYTSDQARDGHERGFLTLLVQLVVQGGTVEIIPNARPGESVADLRARIVFGPELQRVFRRQVEMLDRVMPNFTDTSHSRVPRTGDTWASLRPFLPVNYPASPLIRDLDASDTQLLSEFYNSVQGIAESLEQWHALEEPLDNYNIWNVLMQRVQHSIRLGQAAVQRFCPDRLYDEIVPVAGTLLVRSQRSLSIADSALKTFQDRCTAAGGSVPVSNPMGLRPSGNGG
jgi:hypothetical protein